VAGPPGASRPSVVTPAPVTTGPIRAAGRRRVTGLRFRTRLQGGERSVPPMSYSQPDPAEETTHADEPEQPDTDGTVEENGAEQAALEIDSADVPTSDA
jgi:hypothetical protein